MYFVPDRTDRCGFYECEECGYRFLALETDEEIACPDCDEVFDYEIGPDEELDFGGKHAKLQKILEGEEVEQYDTLLSLAITGGDYEWI